MKRSRIITTIGFVLIVLGIAGTAPTLYYRWLQPGAQPAAPTVFAQVNQNLKNPASDKPKPVYGNPSQLDIASLKMSLPIINGYYNQKSRQWSLTLNKVQYATISAMPNDHQGNTFLYGHYRPEVFAYLHLIKPNSEAVITTDNGYRFFYQLSSIRDTKPNDTSIFAYTGSPILTIQTCSGAWFQNRQLYTFNFVRYEKI